MKSGVCTVESGVDEASETMGRGKEGFQVRKDCLFGFDSKSKRVELRAKVGRI